MILQNVRCFYPCFNGIRVGTDIKKIYDIKDRIVSILVLMELELEQEGEEREWENSRLVSILVLMELELEQE